MNNTINLKILIFLFVVLFFQSCDKENNEDDGSTVYYKIYLDTQNRFIKILENEESTTSYQYTDSTVKICNTNYCETYFINKLGLADSCLLEDMSWLGGWQKPNIVSFKYNKDNYMEFNGEGSFWYKYDEGNRTEAIQDSSINEYSRREYYFSYSSLPNTIDLESYRGPFLGKLNRNLISKTTYNDGTLKNLIVEYSYVLDNKNRVIKRTEIFTFVDMSTHKTIRKYEYIILAN